MDGEVKFPGVYDFYSGLTAFAACIMAVALTITQSSVIRSSESGGQQTLKGVEKYF